MANYIIYLLYIVFFNLHIFLFRYYGFSITLFPGTSPHLGSNPLESISWAMPSILKLVAFMHRRPSLNVLRI